MSVKVVHGECVATMAAMAPDSIDAVCCDPPYHLTGMKNGGGSGSVNPLNRGQSASPYSSSGGFMGCKWDGGDVAFRPETWAAVLRVMRPGAYLVAFASTRGYHRMVCAIEDAGFAIHPMLAWVTAAGFPKAHDFTRPFDEKLLGFTRDDDPKDWEMSRSHFATYWAGHRTGLQSLKPAVEPICLAQKPFTEPTGHENVLRWGTGALNIDKCRVAASTPVQVSAGSPGFGAGRDDGYEHGTGRTYGASARWPSNLCHDGSPAVLDAFAKFGGTKTVAQYDFSSDNGPFDEEPSCTETVSTAGVSSSPDRPMSSEGLGGSVAENADDMHSENRKENGLQREHSVSVTVGGIGSGEKRVVATQLNSSNIGGCGSENTDPSPRDSMSITRTMTVQTIDLPTLNYEQRRSITHTTSASEQASSWTRRVDDVDAKDANNGNHSKTSTHEERAPTADIARPARLNISGNGAPTDNSPARFFKECPPDPSERFWFSGKAPGHEREGGHPTQKPLSLMIWLCQLICPPGGTILDPFAGTGTTLAAADYLGFDAIGIEQDAKTCADAEAKIRRLRARRMIGADVSKEAPAPGQMDLGL